MPEHCPTLTIRASPLAPAYWQREGKAWPEFLLQPPDPLHPPSPPAEKSTMWPGQGLSIQYDEILHNARSDFQHVVVMQTKAYGKVLLLDGE